jgi:hypothetical protein
MDIVGIASFFTTTEQNQNKRKIPVYLSSFCAYNQALVGSLVG